MLRPRNILMTADTVGGVWTYALELARALQPHDVEVQLALMGPPLTAAQRADADTIPNLSLFKSDYKLEWMPDCWSDVKRAGDWLLHLASRLRPDVIHLNGYAHANLSWRDPILVVGHSCVFSWWQAVHGCEPTAEWQRYKREVTNGLRAADMVVTPTAAMLKALNTHYGRIENGCVIANGRDTQVFKPAEKQPLILSAGRLWDAAKNIGCVAELAAELPWRVCVAGEVEAPQQTQPQPTFSKRCEALGPLPEAEMREWFGVASIYALPAVYEPFGYTPLEAGLSGCALVLGDIESLRETWDGAAVFVDPHDRAALKTELRRLIEDDRYRYEMSCRAHMRALQFTSERMAQNYLDAYSELLAQVRTVRREETIARCA
ncbi:MAG TPA: glycosyltransferase family 4 protein [Pyrinomonadaceae bacterium]